MRKAGKQIGKWRFKVAGVEIVVPYRLNEAGRNGAYFFVADESLAIEDRDTDLAALKQRVQSAVINGARVTWEPYLRVTTRGSGDSELDANYNRVECGIGLVYSRLEIGTRPDGSKCWRDVGNHGTRVFQGEPEEEDLDELDDFGQGCVKAIIPETPENVAALERIRKSFDNLANQLLALLSPKEIVGALAMVNAGQARRLEFSPAETVPPTKRKGKR